MGNSEVITATFKTNAVEECNELRKSLIIWAQNQATGQRTQAAIANRKRVTDAHNAKAESYDFIVKYLEGMEIKEDIKEKTIKTCPDTNEICEEYCNNVDCYLKLSKEGSFEID